MNKIYAIYDKKANSFDPVFMASNDLVCQRNLTSVINSPNSPYKDYAEDYALYCLADFDNVVLPSNLNDVPQLHTYNSPHLVCSFADLIKEQ